jgi:2-methylcitrate dehydratase PrpD
MKEGFGTEKKRFPKTVPEAQFSLFYGPAVAILKRKVWLDDFSEEAIRRPDVLAMCQKIEVVADPEKDALSVLIPPTDVEIETKDGKRYTMHVEAMPGHPQNPLSWSGLAEKLKECRHWSARPLSESKMGQLRNMTEYLERLDDVTEILSCLT